MPYIVHSENFFTLQNAKHYIKYFKNSCKNFVAIKYYLKYFNTF